jgi:hypothetical protein
MILEKAVAAELVKLSAYYGNQKFITVFTRAHL